MQEREEGGDKWKLGTCKNIGHTPTIIIYQGLTWDWSLGTENLVLF